MPQYLSTNPNEGMVGSKYLSTDPNEGLEKQYLSTDPNAGLDQEEDEGPSLFGRGLDVLSRVGNTIGRFGASTAAVAKEGVEGFQQGQGFGDFVSDAVGALGETWTPTGIGTWKRNDDFDKVLGQAGMEEGWTRAGLGLAGDIFIDPLQSGAVRKLIGAGVKGAGQLAHVPQAAQAVKNFAPIKATTNVIQDTFDPLHTLRGIQSTEPGIDAATDMRLIESALRHEGERGTEIAGDVFSAGKNELQRMVPLSKAQQAKEIEFLHAIEQGRAVDPSMAHQASEWKRIMDEQWQTKIDMGSIDPKKHIQNYVPHFLKTGENVEATVGAALKGVSRTDMDRKAYKTLAEAVDDLGADKVMQDPRQVLAVAVSANQKAARVNEFFKDVIAKNYAKDTAQTGYRKLNRQRLGQMPDQTWEALKGKYVPEELAGHLEKAKILWEKPAELDNIYKSGLKIWKGLATSVNPPHHFTNFLGNISNMYVSGMSMPEITKAIKQGYQVAKAKKLPEVTLAGGRKITSDELTGLARKYEIIGTSNQLRELTAEGTAEAIVNNPLLKAARHLGTKWAEEPARLGLFLHEVQKGTTPKLAAIKVKNVLFDYAELSDAERKIRDYGLVPFYTWMRKNTPLQMRQLVDQPQQFEKIGDVLNAPWNAMASKVNETVIPERDQAQGYVPGPMAAEGDMLTMNRLNLPQNDLNRITDPLGMVGDSLGPVPKIIMDMANQAKNGRGITTSTGFTTPSGLASIISAMTPDVVENALPDWMQGYVNTVNVAGKPAQRDISAWLMKQLPTGLYGTATRQDDPSQPQILDGGKELSSRFFGLTPNVISPDDMTREMSLRNAAYRRDKMSKILMEQ